MSSVGLDGAVARRVGVLAGRDASPVCPHCAMRLPVGCIVVVAAMDGAKVLGRIASTAGNILDPPAELGVFPAEMVTPHPRPAGVLSPNGWIGIGHHSGVLPCTIDLLVRQVHVLNFLV